MDGLFHLHGKFMALTRACATAATELRLRALANNNIIYLPHTHTHKLTGRNATD